MRVEKENDLCLLRGDIEGYVRDCSKVTLRSNGMKLKVCDVTLKCFKAFNLCQLSLDFQLIFIKIHTEQLSQSSLHYNAI